MFSAASEYDILKDRLNHIQMEILDFIRLVNKFKLQLQVKKFICIFRSVLVDTPREIDFDIIFQQSNFPIEIEKSMVR